MRPIYSADFTNGSSPNVSTGANAMHVVSRSWRICRRASEPPPLPPNDRPSCASLTSGFNSMKKTPAPFTSVDARAASAYILRRLPAVGWAVTNVNCGAA